MKLPSESQCLNWFEEFKVPGNVREHCQRVREVANFLAKDKIKKGMELNLELVDRTAFLHDLFKVVSFNDMEALRPSKFHNYTFTPEEIAMWKVLRQRFPNMHEGEASFSFFKEEYPELAFSLRNVSDLRHLHRTWEELIVHYADWRVFRNEVVPLQERLEYLRESYSREREEWEKDFQAITSFEQSIMKVLQRNPEDLSNEIKISI